ncbi:flagellar protein FlaG [Idiomarina fontislapidosi]|uniref:Flagellar biosynthesis protein FlaG n=1 Tax=Idiomarina fontislapidosi TaxID=263723 RepID=A0A432XYU1_9GAMM|nr:flagellar protein FlaG [Idiomarina fontislapidosi]PYE32765.1 flagellar protein FlaG [Idiomarina fontislapidosi]RUO53794.1 hypothetical protein CWE25_07850 [Idiomarina fontislapidosi]
MGIEINAFSSSSIRLTKQDEEPSAVQANEKSVKTAAETSVINKSTVKNEEANGIATDSQQSIERVNELVQELNDNSNIRRKNLELVVNDDIGQTIVKVVDSESGEVIRQIPSEELVRLSERLKESDKIDDIGVGYLIDSVT